MAKSIVFELKKVNNKVHKALVNRYKNMNMTISPVQSKILVFIYENDNVTATDILEEFKIVNKSSLSEILNNMEKNGLIIRIESNTDARKKIIEVTDKSMDIIKILRDDADKVSNLLSLGISDEEYKTFIQILDKIERNIDKV